MPAATPIPRGPAVLTLYTAWDLLTAPGCPVCRYAGEAADRYLAWFAVEGHADAVTVTRLCTSLGMCPRHTRGLMRQPGAAGRLTALYRYLTREARDRLSGPTARIAGCPACEHDDGAAGRALETLLDGLADGQVRDRYRELGGMCLAHLRAASARGDRRVRAWLSRTVAAAADSQADPGWRAGTSDDADIRVALRGTPPAAAATGPGMCAACLAAGRSEHSWLAGIARGGSRGDSDAPLCADHLGDLIVMAGPPDPAPLLAWQADRVIAALAGTTSSPDRGPGPASWFRSRRGAGNGPCPVCQVSDAAARRTVGDLRGRLRAGRPDDGRQVPLCVRHLLILKAADPRAGRLAAPGAIERADSLIAELDQAFANGTWARRREAKGAEMTAWRRAAAFLDGGVFCGCPPRRVLKPER